jgi:hypothetical protein
LIITPQLNCDALMFQLTDTNKILLIILQSINTHATDWLSRWIWSFSMVHHRTASKKICLHVQHKYIRVSCNSFFQINIRLKNIWLQYHISNLQFLTGIIIENHDKDPGLVSRHKRDSSYGKKRAVRYISLIQIILCAHVCI